LHSVGTQHCYCLTSHDCSHPQLARARPTAELPHGCGSSPAPPPQNDFRCRYRFRCVAWITPPAAFRTANAASDP